MPGFDHCSGCSFFLPRRELLRPVVFFHVRPFLACVPPRRAVIYFSVVIHAPVYQCTSRVCTVVVLAAAITGFRVVGSWRCFATLQESLNGKYCVRRFLFPLDTILDKVRTTQATQGEDQRIFSAFHSPFRLACDNTTSLIHASFVRRESNRGEARQAAGRARELFKCERSGERFVI